MNKGWANKEVNLDEDLDQDMLDIEKGEDFERSYNFRFQEP